MTGSNKRATNPQVQKWHNEPTSDDGTMSLEHRVQDGMLTHSGGEDSCAGSTGQAHAQDRRMRIQRMSLLKH